MDNKDSVKPQQVPPMNIIRTPEVGAALSGPNTVPSAGTVLEPDLQSHIGRQLRAVYDEILNEPVPDRFLKLLEELERQRSDDNE